MDRDVWKWLFSEMSDSNILQLVNNLNKTLTAKSQIAIKGISDLRNIRVEQLRLFRSRIETELNKPKNTLRVKNILNKYHEQADTEKNKILRNISIKESDAIWEELKETTVLNVHDVIEYLVIQSDEEQINKGVQLHNKLLAKAAKKEPSITEPSSSDTIVEIFNVGALPSPEKLASLLVDFEQVKREYKKLQDEKQQVIKSNKELKKSISQTESQRNDLLKVCQKLEREVELRKTEIGDRDRKNKDLYEQLTELQKAEGDLRKEYADLQARIKVIEEENNAKDEQLRTISQAKMFTIIDRTLPDGLDVPKFTKVNLILPNDLEDIIQTNALDQSDEIWFIKFRLSVPKQNLLHEKYGKKVTGFNTYNDLKNHCISR
ncbi:hypothetical protein [Cohnella phaseoli]|uniref:Uncharacterized protein n=1 Tax=Cohnella phaseoli TaxID=456490 RepID=A0A3D9IC89_9BACL|nr:hypothetical protein [Cohnella phaseoli]RED59159.1 hypothetical protein DFP98_13282 [Cohnella phaseoli]